MHILTFNLSRTHARESCATCTHSNYEFLAFFIKESLQYAILHANSADMQNAHTSWWCYRYPWSTTCCGEWSSVLSYIWLHCLTSRMPNLAYQTEPHSHMRSSMCDLVCTIVLWMACLLFSGVECLARGIIMTAVIITVASGYQSIAFCLYAACWLFSNKNQLSLDGSDDGPLRQTYSIH